MIEVLNNPKKEKTQEIDCECGALLRYTDSDIGTNQYNDKGIICPCCNKWITLEYSNPFAFPRAFYHFGKTENAAILSDEDTQKYIDTCVRTVKETIGTEDWDYALTNTGDTFVLATRDEDGITVRVAKNYYEAIDFS